MSLAFCHTHTHTRDVTYDQILYGKFEKFMNLRKYFCCCICVWSSHKENIWFYDNLQELPYIGLDIMLNMLLCVSQHIYSHTGFRTTTKYDDSFHF